MSQPLRPIFEPRSVAVVGASADPEKRGHQVVAALRASGFPGPVFPVNPRGGEIHGYTVFASVDELPEAPDLAYIALPAAAGPDTVAACGRRGIRGAIVPAVGFGESGPEGARLEARLLDAARETGIRVVGPNTSGLLNTAARLHMVGGEPLEPGGLAILAQSGNIALDLMTSAAARPLGVSVYVGPGNETDIGFHEYLEFLGAHEATKAIAMYVEGVKDGRALYETALRVSPGTPIVVHKGGRSRRGRAAARSHTGAVAGSHEVFRALAREAGMTVVDRSDELLPVAEALATQPPPGGGDRDGAGVVILSDGGGHGTLATDRLVEAGVPLARLGESTRAELRELLGPAASVANPIDCAGATDRAPMLFARALEVAAADPACTGILMIGLFGGYAIRFAAGLAHEERETADALAAGARGAGLPLVVHSLYAARSPAPLVRLLELGVPVSGSLEIAARAMAALCERGGATTRVRAGADQPVASPGTSEAATAKIDRAGEPPVHWLSEAATRELLAPYDVPLVPARFCRTVDDARDAASGTDGRFALKAVSSRLPHKTEAGAVALGLEGPDEAAEAFDRVVAATRAYLRAHELSEEIEGVLVSPMQPDPIVELLVGARRDPQFGPILTIGRGGTEVELSPDVAIRALPIEPDTARQALLELDLAPLLLGHRGRPRADVEAIGRLAVELGRALLDHSEIVEIELNPVFAYPENSLAIDASARVFDV